MPSFDPDLPFAECFGITIRSPPPIEDKSSPQEAFRSLQTDGQFWSRQMLLTEPDHEVFRTHLEEWVQVFRRLTEDPDALKGYDLRGVAILKM